MVATRTPGTGAVAVQNRGRDAGVGQGVGVITDAGPVPGDDSDLLGNAAPCSALENEVFFPSWSRLRVVVPRDTTPAAQEVQLRWLRRLSPAARVAVAVEMSEDVREIARAGIAARHPEYSATQVTFALLRLLMGDDLFHRAWPRAPLLAP